MKKKKQSGMLARIIKQLLIGGVLGAVFGGIIGFAMSYFNIAEKGQPFSQC